MVFGWKRWKAAGLGQWGRKKRRGFEREKRPHLGNGKQREVLQEIRWGGCPWRPASVPAVGCGRAKTSGQALRALLAFGAEPLQRAMAQSCFYTLLFSYLPIDRLGASTLASVAKLREPRPRQVVYRAEWPQDETPAVSTLVCCIQELDGREHSRQVPSFSVATTCQRARDR